MVCAELRAANLAAGNRLRDRGHGLRLRLGRRRVSVGLERFVDLAKRRMKSSS